MREDSVLKLANVGILVPSPDLAVVLRAQIRATGLGTVVLDATAYPRLRSDMVVRRFLEARPEMIVVDGHDTAAATEAVRVLHTAMPAAWIIVSTSILDAQVILEMVRGGAREIIPNPTTQASLAYALQHYIEEREREHKSDSYLHGKLYSICAGKRGSGATTVAINMAAFLSEIPDSRVALIDLDWPVGDAAAYLNIVPRFTVANALASAMRLDPVLLESYMHKHDRIHVLPGLETFESGQFLTPDPLGQLLEVVAQVYTHAVVDLPPTLSRELVQTVTRVSDTILAVLTPDVPSLRRTERLLRFFAEFETPGKIRLVLNRAKKTDEITEGTIEKTLKHAVSWKISNDYYACAEAINHGKTLLAGSSKYLTRDFREFARQLAGFEPEDKRRVY